MSDNYFPIGTLIKVQGHNLIYLGYINDRGVDDEYGVHLIASEDSFTIRTKNDKIYSSTVHWLNYTRVAREFVIDHAQQVWDTFPFTQKERSFLFIKTKDLLPLLEPASLEKVINSLELELNTVL